MPTYQASFRASSLLKSAPRYLSRTPTLRRRRPTAWPHAAQAAAAMTERRSSGSFEASSRSCASLARTRAPARTRPCNGIYRAQRVT
eukprot:6209158-Pleurochrysis_carterae.AAC.3